MTALSCGDDEVLGDDGDCGPNGDGFLASASALKFEALPIKVRGEAGCDWSARDGDADSEGALNGLNDTEGLL